jgi:hypothetical protein
MVNVEVEEIITRDYSRAAQVLIAIGLRILEEEEHNEPDPGLREGVD